MAYFPYVSFVSVISFNDTRFVSYIALKFVGVSSKHLRVFLESLRQSSEIFGKFRKFSENAGERSSGLRNSFSSEIFGKSSKTPSSVCLYNKRNITRWLEDMNFMFSWQEQYPTRSLRSLVRYCSCCEIIKFISSRHRVISSIYVSISTGCYVAVSSKD